MFDDEIEEPPVDDLVGLLGRLLLHVLADLGAQLVERLEVPDLLRQLVEEDAQP